MPQWGKTDNAANSVSWADDMVISNGGNTSLTQTTLFGNTSNPPAVKAGVKIGQFGVDSNEAQAARSGSGDKVSHSGWVLRTEGTGGRAGRVQYETLVAMGTITGDAEDVIFEDFTIEILTQPSDASANSSADEQATFTVVATSTPSTSLTYLWQYTTDPGNTASFATTVAVGGFADQTTDTLTVDANTIADGTLVRVVVSATGADSVTSDNAELTVTS